MDKKEKNIHIDNFETHWDDLSEQEKKDLIRQAEKHEPNRAVIAVLKGLNSAHLSVRSQARKTLEIILEKINDLLDQPYNTPQHKDGLKISARVCAVLFSRFFSGSSFKEQDYIFKTMLRMKGFGPQFAFKAISTKRYDVQSALRIAMTLPVANRLYYTGAYMNSSPGLRMAFAAPFKKLLQSVNDLESVVHYYAVLFDTQENADVFLLNLEPRMRDVKAITQVFVRSPHPKTRSRGLKALAMIMPKIPQGLFIEFLNDEKDPGVRQTLYRIIENASLGAYKKMYPALMALLEKRDRKEAYFAFKALIMTGAKPLHEMIKQVSDVCPKIMGHIYDEISRLSKISFYFIQDIALNPDIYLQDLVEINLAAVFGMIKKRPERVVKWLAEATQYSDDKVKKEISLFIKKTNDLLDKEKKGMYAKFSRIKKENEQPPKDDEKGLLASIFSPDTLPKRINSLKARTFKSKPDFEKEHLHTIDMSGLKCKIPGINFSAAVFQHCNLNQSSFFNSNFKGAVFINVDFRSAEFDSACFCDAVFINANASGAIFKNCDFINISMANCDFGKAKMPGSFFINATVFKCRFNDADLTGSSFAFSDLSAVSLEHARLDHADFTGIQARFSRFPFHAREAISRDDINLNARAHQLELADMPPLDTAGISHLNKLIFSEFIHYGEKKFIRQNRHRLLTAFDIFKPRQADLFSIIPFLIHENTVLPGTRISIDKQTPHGITDYHPDPQTLDILSRHSTVKPVSHRNRTGCILGLYTIGSIGSVAQTDDSDIDYWVCLSQEQIGDKGLQLLRQKLDKLERYAIDLFQIQVTFFIVDILSVLQNDFGDSSTESSGSAQALLLKEEFYRTMIHVAGKLPLWSLLPTAVSKNYYNDIQDLILTFPSITRYIDLGDIHAVEPGEFFGATIWQLFKSLKSPFKSVIKIALLEKYISEKGGKPLLCNSVKDEWMNSGVNLRLAQNDAYYILLENLLSFYVREKDTESVSLILACFYLKLGIYDLSKIEATAFGFRKVLLEKCMENFNISRQRLVKIGSYRNWSYTKLYKLNRQIESFMIKKYKAINLRFESAGVDSAQISAEDRTVLGRKVFSELSKTEGKITKNILIAGNKNYFHTLHIDYNDSSPQQRWQLVNIKSKNQSPDILIQTRTIEEIYAWLIRNKLLSKNTILNLRPNPTPVTADNLKKLHRAMQDFFEPIISTPVGFQELLSRQSVTVLFIVLNFYAPKHQKIISDYSAIFVNSWGEMFIQSFKANPPLEKISHVVSHVLKQLNLKQLPPNSVCYLKGKIKSIFNPAVT